MSETESLISYRFLGPIKRGQGWCTAACNYDVNGVCRKCECLDPARFLVTEYPTEDQDGQRKIVERLIAAGVEVFRVR